MHGTETWWDALRRRKVVQWGIVYVAGAWGFLQGLEYLSGTYDWPRQIPSFATPAPPRPRPTHPLPDSPRVSHRWA